MNTIRNNVQLMGNLGGAPEVKVFDNGGKIARFSLAVSERYKNHMGEPVTETHWHTIIARGRQADFAEQYLEKGKEVLVNGRLVNRSYTDKTGTKRWITEIQLTDLVLTGKKAA